MGILPILTVSLFIGFQLPVATIGIINLSGAHGKPSEASVGQFPWQVLVETTKPAGVGRIALSTCGASIIDEYWVMGAAHCFVKNKYNKDGKPDGFDIIATNIVLYAGIISKDDKNGTNVQKRNYNEEEIRAGGMERVMFINEHYNKVTEDANDIALFKLKQPLVMTKNNVELITFGTVAYRKPRMLLTASGWGSMSESAEEFPIELRYVEGMVLAPWNHCYMNILNFTDTQICQFTRGKATYLGDSGGAVITEKRTRNGLLYVQVGIISKNTRPPLGERFLSVFTNVEKFKDWIQLITSLII